MKVLTTHRPLASCGFVAFMLLSTGAIAQSTLADNAAAPSDRLEEIVVTAQKRTENLQNVPIAVQVIKGQALAENNYNSLGELTQTVPGVHVSTGQYSNSLTIRGVGSGANNPSYDQSVATFVDDIYFGRSRTSAATFFDLDRVEVLKGPQSTFFGNNAIAGALNIVTKQPGDTVEAAGRLLYGQYGQYAVEGAIGGPLSDTFSARIAVARNGQSGWIENVDTGRDAPDENNEAARLTLLYKPSEDLRATLKIEGSQNRTSGSSGDPPQWVNCPPPAPFPATRGNPSCTQALAQGVPLGLNNDNNSGLPGVGDSLSTAAAVLTISYQHWGDTFTSVSGVDNYHFGSAFDSVLPIKVLETQTAEKYSQFSQEFRVTSPADQTIEYLAGVYFQTDKLNERINPNVPFADFIATIPGLGALTPYLPLSFFSANSQDEKVYSVFGSLKWNISDDLKLNAGLRGSRVTKDPTLSLHYGTSSQVYGGYTPVPPGIEQLWTVAGLGPPGSQSLSQSYQALMPSAGVQYQLRPNAMIYLTYNKGFKAGGFNALTPTNAPSEVEFGPEHVNAYELGLKSKLFDDTLLLNLAVFRDDYKDLQSPSSVYFPETQSYSPLIQNAASARSEGVELETLWIVTRDFRLGADVSYLHSYYESFPNASPSNLQNYCARNYALPYCSVYLNPVPAFANLAGQPTAYSPKWSGSIEASYSVPLPGDYKITTTLDPFVSSGYTTAPGDTLYQLGGYLRLDGRLTLENPGGHWAVDVIGKNLANRIIEVHPPNNLNPSIEAKEEPRNVAIQVRYRY